MISSLVHAEHERIDARTREEFLGKQWVARHERFAHRAFLFLERILVHVFLYFTQHGKCLGAGFVFLEVQAFRSEILDSLQGFL